MLVGLMGAIQELIEMQPRYFIITHNISSILLLFLVALSACSPDNEAAQGTPVKERELVKEREVMPFEILHNPQYAIYQSDDLVALNVVTLKGKGAYRANREEFLALDKAGIKKFEDDIIASQENIGGWFLPDCGEEYFCVTQWYAFAIPKGEIGTSWTLKISGYGGLQNINCKLQNTKIIQGREVYSIACDNDSNVEWPMELTYSRQFGVETMRLICKTRCGDDRKYTLISKKGIFATED